MQSFMNCEDIIRTGFSLIQLVLIDTLLNLLVRIGKIITKLKVASYKKANCETVALTQGRPAGWFTQKIT